MAPNTEANRRALVVFYRQFLAADRAWRVAQIEAMSWFPKGKPSSVMQIGDPGSRIRRLYDRRDQALNKLNVAQIRVKESRVRKVQRLQVLVLPRN